LWIVPRRARCTGCGATHVLLPVLLLVRRADTAAVIGAGLTAKATGAGHRLIAALLGRPAETVRGWLRRFASRVEPVRTVFTRWCRDLQPDPVLVRAENRDTVLYQRLCGHTADRPRSRRPAPAQHDLPLWPSDSRT